MKSYGLNNSITWAKTLNFISEVHKVGRSKEKTLNMQKCLSAQYLNSHIKDTYEAIRPTSAGMNQYLRLVMLQQHFWWGYFGKMLAASHRERETD